ncbi:vegetative incompatibility protein HET-E-1 [Podospora australis]|uniref:Vegetative incompatibility protein HET-E-1 n=1 Tax=Podospora australis TaxID=1536484 RepID=A0AAN6WLB3_9PEZI|nr:vegetative incompatibility protein HET-E-1 [Podospora australis]
MSFTSNASNTAKRRRTTQDEYDLRKTVPLPATKIARGQYAPSEYGVGWICALPIEMTAARVMLGAVHEAFQGEQDEADTNSYILGNIGPHNIVIACLPSGHYGTNNAASVVSHMRRSFPSIRAGLMVGIGGGVPLGKADVRLGDVVVSEQVIQYDFGKTEAAGTFKRTGTAVRPPQALLTAVARLRADHEIEASRIQETLSEMLERHPRLKDYAYSLSLPDRVFHGTYDHVNASGSANDDCELCDETQWIQRPPRESSVPNIHYGIIASGNQVMKRGETRDKIAQELGAICFEMEAAGLMDSFPCLVIRGICDYCDSHKNQGWQKYAAATAAAYAKELLSVLPNTTPRDDASVRARLQDEARKEEQRRIRRRQRLLESLIFEQLDVRLTSIQESHTDTCEWLLSHPDYLTWLGQDNLAEHHV